MWLWEGFGFGALGNRFVSGGNADERTVLLLLTLALQVQLDGR